MFLMPRTASGPRHPARHPLLRVWRLELTARLRQIPVSTRLLGLLAVTALMITALQLRAGLVALVAEQPADTGLLTGVLMSVLMQLGRRTYADYYHHGWLATLPVTARYRLTIILVRAAIWPALVLMFAWCVAGMLWLVVPVSRDQIVTATLAITGGAFVGALIGWSLPGQRSGAAAPAPLIAGVDSSRTASLAGLSTWASLLTRAWLRPRILARSLLPILLALPLGISANAAIAVVVIAGLLLYLGVLMFATLRAMRDSRAWLRPTPLPFSRSALEILRRPYLVQLQCTLVAAILLIALGCGPRLAFRAAEFWLSIVTVMSGLALARTERSASMAGRTLLSIFILAAAERLKAFASLPVALLITTLQSRKAERA